MQNNGGISKLYLFWSNIINDLLYKERTIFDKLCKFWYFSLPWCRHNCFLMIVATHVFFSFMMLYSSPNFLVIKTPLPIFYFFQLISRKNEFVFQCFILVGTFRKVFSSQKRIVSLQPMNVPINVHNSILNIICFYIYEL